MQYSCILLLCDPKMKFIIVWDQTLNSSVVIVYREMCQFPLPKNECMCRLDDKRKHIDSLQVTLDVKH